MWRKAEEVNKIVRRVTGLKMEAIIGHNFRTSMPCQATRLLATHTNALASVYWRVNSTRRSLCNKEDASARGLNWTSCLKGIRFTIEPSPCSNSNELPRATSKKCVCRPGDAWRAHFPATYGHQIRTSAENHSDGDVQACRTWKMPKHLA